MLYRTIIWKYYIWKYNIQKNLNIEIIITYRYIKVHGNILTGYIKFWKWKKKIWNSQPKYK